MATAQLPQPPHGASPLVSLAVSPGGTLVSKDKAASAHIAAGYADGSVGIFTPKELFGADSMWAKLECHPKPPDPKAEATGKAAVKIE